MTPRPIVRPSNIGRISDDRMQMHEPLQVRLIAAYRSTLEF
jgi:hypothetical protein